MNECESCKKYEECMQCPARAKCVTVHYGSKRCIMTRWSYDINSDPKPITNAERIRAMSDEELAKFLCEFRSLGASNHPCNVCKAEEFCSLGHNGMIDWLHRPAEEDV